MEKLSKNIDSLHRKWHHHASNSGQLYDKTGLYHKVPDTRESPSRHWHEDLTPCAMPAMWPGSFSYLRINPPVSQLIGGAWWWGLLPPPGGSGNPRLWCFSVLLCKDAEPLNIMAASYSSHFLKSCSWQAVCLCSLTNCRHVCFKTRMGHVQNWSSVLMVLHWKQTWEKVAKVKQQLWLPGSGR